jgi:hypothetical protein
MLAATYGRTIDPRWHDLWGKAGAIGLLAAVILERTEKSRLRRKTRIRKEASRVVSENRLAQLNEQHSTRNSVVEAIHELTAFAGAELDQYPVTIFPVDDNDEAFEIDSAECIRGELINISPNTVCFAHDETFANQIVLLQFKLHKRKTLCFVVEIVGRQPSDDGFISTGAVLAAGVPESTEAEAGGTEADSAETLQPA